MFKINKKDKKAEIDIMVYLLALVIIGIILLVGFNLTSSLKNRNDQLSTIVFEKELAKDIKELSSSFKFGSQVKKTYDLPAGFNEICFIDVDNVDPENIDKDIIKNSVDNQVQDNVFLFGKSVKSFHVQGLSLVDPFYSCTKSGSFSLVIEGKGDSALIYTPAYKTYCENAQNGNLCDGLDIAFYNGYRVSCCSEYTLCCG